ncbi:MAG: methyltransferase domain-containing protein [Chloroflexota bacterium]|nr:methyltransferase domain-containing protein [Chloroflexota bacterium]
MTCLLCGSENQHPFALVESFGYPLSYVQCDRCGLVFQSEEGSQAADPDFYVATYRKIYQSSEEPTAKDLWVQNRRAQHLISVLRSKGVVDVKRMLDIGASAGVLLGAFHDAYGCEVTGVEPGDAYRTFAADQGIEMFASLPELIGQGPERFDLVSLSHVLEHLPNPVETLRSIREDLLTPDGTLLLEVPNFYAHDSYELAHLACYTPHTLREVARQAGFEVVRLARHGVPRSALLNLYLTLMARPATETVQRSVRPEKNVKLKRRIGFLYRRVVQKLFPHRAWLPLPNGEAV